METSITRDRLQVLADTVALIKKAFEQGKDWDAWVLSESIEDLEETLYLSNQLTAHERFVIKAYRESERRANDTRRRSDLP